MTEQQHVPIEDLAAFAAGDLDASAAVTVEAHVVLCAECRSDVAAVRAATDALAALPSETMPPLVAGRLDDALAAERAGTRAPAGTVLPIAPRRRRPTFAGLTAVAAVVALFAAISIPLVTGGGRKDAGDSAGSAASAQRDGMAENAATRRLASGLAYDRENLVVTLDRALAGVVDETAGQPAPAAATPLAEADDTAKTRASSAQLTAMRTDPGRLAACVQELVGTGPLNGRTPLVVDFARFIGREAVILVFPSVQSNGAPRPGRVDVYVVGTGCGVEPGGDVLDFQRIQTPRI